jgi:hypothetical protein
MPSPRSTSATTADVACLRQDAIGHVDERHWLPSRFKALRELAADRSGAHYNEALRQRFSDQTSSDAGAPTSPAPGSAE